MQNQGLLKHNRKQYSKAFPLRLADDSQGVGVYTRDGKALADTGALLSFLEYAIHLFAEAGNREGLRRALKQYALAWIRLERGVL